MFFHCSRVRFSVRAIYGIGLNIVKSLLCNVNYSGYIESCR